MASPVYTKGAAGNGLASQALAAGASVTFTLDLSAAFDGFPQVGGTFGTIAATAGLQVSVFRKVGSTPVADTNPGPGSFVLAAVAGAQAQTVPLSTGVYSIKLTNLDATNSLTAVYCTYDNVSGVA